MSCDPEECEVFCLGCNGYLFSVSVYDTNGQTAIGQKCPFECKTEYDPSSKRIITVMKVPEGWGQKYGKS